MLFLKLVRGLAQALTSEGTPGQVAAGVALGAVFGLTPLVNLHNVVLFGCALILNVSLPGVVLGWVVAVPVGFALDPVFNALGSWLLGATTLQPFWTALDNLPVVPFTNFNNTVVLGSFVIWLLSVLPVFLVARWLVVRYRATVLERLRTTRIFQAITASRLFTTYRALGGGRS